MIWDKKMVDEFMANVLPPSIKSMPKDAPMVLDGEDDSELFFNAIVLAVMLDNDDNPLLLDALRAKWPDDVERELPRIREGVAADEAEIERRKAELDKRRVA